jgi:large subunit ribosomal protein L15
MAGKTKKQSEAPEQPKLTLTMLKPAKGSTKDRVRVGRGRSSGVGKTSGRGHNGEGQRSGQSSKRGFEGGQMPGYRQMPKINGFRIINRKKWLELNLSDLSNILLPEEQELSYDVLLERGYLRPTHDGVRILGNGEVNRKLTVFAHHVTESAREKIEAAGGTIQLHS